jgi:hypothetical protein
LPVADLFLLGRYLGIGIGVLVVGEFRFVYLLDGSFDGLVMLLLLLQSSELLEEYPE